MGRLVTLPGYLPLPSAAVLAVNNSIFDVGVVAAFGLVGYVMWRQEIPMAPLVIRTA